MTKSEQFFQENVREMCRPGARLLDIGAGLRIDPVKSNVLDSSRFWIRDLMKACTYEVMDPVDTYHPDIVGDIMQMPMKDASYDGIFCLAVLEHVPEAWKGVDEMYRVVKPGGRVFVYMPFLSPYHAMPGYYGDYVRFTDDGLKHVFRHFSRVDLVPVRGPMETIVHLMPLRRLRPAVMWCARRIDRLHHASGKQASGFMLCAVK